MSKIEDLRATIVELEYVAEEAQNALDDAMADLVGAEEELLELER